MNDSKINKRFDKQVDFLVYDLALSIIPEDELTFSKFKSIRDRFINSIRHNFISMPYCAIPISELNKVHNKVMMLAIKENEEDKEK